MNDDPSEEDLDAYDHSVYTALRLAENHARLAHDLASKADTLTSTGTAAGEALANLAEEGYARNAAIASAYLAAAGFGDHHELHAFLHLDWLGREP